MRTNIPLGFMRVQPNTYGFRVDEENRVDERVYDTKRVFEKVNKDKIPF